MTPEEAVTRVSIKVGIEELNNNKKAQSILALFLKPFVVAAVKVEQERCIKIIKAVAEECGLNPISKSQGKRMSTQLSGKMVEIIKKDCESLELADEDELFIR